MTEPGTESKYPRVPNNEEIFVAKLDEKSPYRATLVIGDESAKAFGYSDTLAFVKKFAYLLFAGDVTKIVPESGGTFVFCRGKVKDIVAELDAKASTK